MDATIACVGAGLGIASLSAVLVLVYVVREMQQQLETDVVVKLHTLATSKHVAEEQVLTIHDELEGMLRVLNNFEDSSGSCCEAVAHQPLEHLQQFLSLLPRCRGAAEQTEVDQFQTESFGDAVMVKLQPDSIFIRGITPLMQSLTQIQDSKPAPIQEGFLSNERKQLGC